MFMRATSRQVDRLDQPPQIRSKDRRNHTEAPVSPPDRLARRRCHREHILSCLVDELIWTDIDDDPSTIHEPDEVVRRIFDASLRIPHRQSKWLASNSNDIRREVKLGEAVTPNPGLESDKVTNCRRPPLTDEVTLPLERSQIPNR